jgi:hypothetical protein
LERVFQSAFDTQRHREITGTENEDQLLNDNKNQGLINTIINHNNKIRNIENTFNIINNNYANSSHAKEIVEKTKELENHVFGALRPHSSWREFLLMTIIIGVILGILVKVGKKYGGAWLLRFIHEKSKSNDNPVNISTIKRLKKGTYLG